MTISTYSELKSAVADFLMRQDLTAVIPSFILLAEASINRKLRHMRMVTRATLDLDSGYVGLPTDWLETISLELDGKGPITLLAPQDMMRVKANQSGAADPVYFTHSGSDLELWPVPSDATGKLQYFSKIAALSDVAPTNWLLTAAPDLYLYGALTHSAPYLKDDARVMVWGGLYADVMQSLNDASERARFSGPLKMGAPRGR